MKKIVNYSFSIQPNSNIKYKINIICKDCNESTLLYYLEFEEFLNIQKFLTEIFNFKTLPKNNIKDHSNLIIYKKNPTVQDSTKSLNLIKEIGKKELLEIVNDCIRFANKYVFLFNFHINTSNEFSFNLNSKEEFYIEYNKIEINIYVLKYYSKKDSFIDSILFYIDRIKLVEKNDFIFYVNDAIIFECYFKIDKYKSKYYGFVDKENVSEPEFIFEVNNTDLLMFLELLVVFLRVNEES